MAYIIQTTLGVAFGLVLGTYILAAIAQFQAWRKERWIRRTLAPGAGIDVVQRPARGQYAEYAPGVQYDREGIALNAVPGARRGVGLLGS